MWKADRHTTADGTPTLLPWVEKYRPNSLDHVVSHKDTVQTIRRFIENGELPHLLFHGPPGTGKTSVVFAIARVLYGNDAPAMMLELNASDERGIQVVRGTIKTFAKTTAVSWRTPAAPSSAPSMRGAAGALSAALSDANENDNPVLNHEGRGKLAKRIKLVVLDEADQMTREAQNALRRIMEKYADHIRFCIVCNIINKIHPAVQSRCTKFRFPPLVREDVICRTKQIADAESLNVNSSGLESLADYAEGDMRKVLNSMQSVALAHPNELIDSNLVLKCLGLPLLSNIEALFRSLSSSDFQTAYSDIENLQRSHGFYLGDILKGLYNYCLRIKWPPSVALMLFPRLAEIEHRLSHGVAEAIEVSALVSAFVEARHEIFVLHQKIIPLTSLDTH